MKNNDVCAAIACSWTRPEIAEAAKKHIEELEAKAAKWDALEKAVSSHASLEDMNADLELAQAVKLAFERARYCTFVGEFNVLEVISTGGLIEWFRDQKRG